MRIIEKAYAKDKTKPEESRQKQKLDSKSAQDQTGEYRVSERPVSDINADRLSAHLPFATR
jgi:hypothetical protein